MPPTFNYLAHKVSNITAHSSKKPHNLCFLIPPYSPSVESMECSNNQRIPCPHPGILSNLPLCQPLLGKFSFLITFQPKYTSLYQAILYTALADPHAVPPNFVQGLPCAVSCLTASCWTIGKATIIPLVLALRTAYVFHETCDI